MKKSPLAVIGAVTVMAATLAGGCARSARTVTTGGIEALGLVRRDEIRAVYQIKTDEQKDGVGAGLHYVKKLLDTYNSIGIEDEATDIHAVLHGDAGYWLLRDQPYAQAADAPGNPNKAIVADWIEQRDFVEWVYPEVGVVAFPRFTIDIDPERAYRKLAEEQATFVVPGRVFEYEARYFRLGFGSLTEHVTEGLARLDQVVQELSAE